VAGPGGEVQEERLARVGGPQVGDELDRPGGRTLWLSWYSAGANWCVSPPWKPYQRSKPRPSGQVTRDAAMLVSSSGDRCHLPTA